MTDLYDQLIGIPWYRPERYNDARARMADAASLPESYNLWLERAEKREQETRTAGATPERVYVDDERFIAFCAEREIIRDGKARSRYAADWCRQSRANVTDYANPYFRHGAKQTK